MGWCPLGVASTRKGAKLDARKTEALRPGGPGIYPSKLFSPALTYLRKKKKQIEVVQVPIICIFIDLRPGFLSIIIKICLEIGEEIRKMSD